MKKLKEIWRNNRVLFVLFIILIICFIAIVTVALTYFIGAEKSPYGNRLDNKIELPKDFEKNIEKLLEEDESIKKADVRLAIRTIYVNIDFENIDIEKAKEKANSSLDLIDEKVLEYYDFNYILTQEAKEENAGFTIMGARNVNGTGFVWNNNTPVEENEEE